MRVDLPSSTDPQVRKRRRSRRSPGDLDFSVMPSRVFATSRATSLWRATVIAFKELYRFACDLQKRELSLQLMFSLPLAPRAIAIPPQLEAAAALRIACDVEYPFSSGT